MSSWPNENPAKAAWTAALLLLLFASLLYAGLARAIESHSAYNTAWLRDRYAAAAGALAFVAAEKEKIVLVFGASNVEVGIAPAKIEAALKKIGVTAKVYNFGFRAADPTAFLAFARRVEHEFSRAGRKADLTLLKLPIGCMTNNYQTEFPHLAAIQGAVQSLATLAELFPRDPLLAFRVGVDRYMLPARTAGDSAWHLRSMLYVEPEWWPLERSREDPRARAWMDLWTSRDLHPDPAWELASRGAFAWGRPAAEARFQALRSELESYDMIPFLTRWYARKFDYFALREAPELTQKIGESAAALRRASEKFAFLDWPDSPDFRHTPEGLETKRAMLEYVRAAAGDAAVWDYSGEKFLENVDFLDFIHLSDSGQTHLADRLAADIARSL